MNDNKDLEHKTIDELIEDAKQLSTMLMQNVLDELHKEYDNHIVLENPFDQIEGVIERFRDAYEESLKPKLRVVKDDEDTIQ